MGDAAAMAAPTLFSFFEPSNDYYVIVERGTYRPGNYSGSPAKHEPTTELGYALDSTRLHVIIVPTGALHQQSDGLTIPHPRSYNCARVRTQAFHLHDSWI